MRPSHTVRRTSTGDVVSSTAYLRQVILTPGAGASSVDVRSGGAGGTVLLSLVANGLLSGDSVSSGPMEDTLCAGGIHVTLAGAGASVSVVYA